MAVAGAAYKLFGGGKHVNRTDLVLHKVKLEPLQLTIVERGALESADNRDVVCRVKAGTRNSTVATTIKWVIDDGSLVKKGQVIVELDDSGLQEQLKTEKITLDDARGAYLQAEEEYKLQLINNESLISNARIALALAEINLEKYREGDYPQALKDVLGKIKIAESDRDMQQERAAWANRMVKKGYMTNSQAQAEQSRLESNEIQLASNKEALRVLNDYTKKLNETDLKNKYEEAQRALERANLQAKGVEIKADVDRTTKKSKYLQEKARYEEIEDEIRKCVIKAPQDGMVVYYVPEQARYGSGSKQSIIAQGESVSEGQKLMRIPDLTHMLVNTKVHEAMVSRVKGEELVPTGFGDGVRAGLMAPPDRLTGLLGLLSFGEMREQFKDKETQMVYGGQHATVRVDAYPNRILPGHVKSVATVAGQQDWLSADVKTYQTMVSIDEPVEGLKPQMSAEVTIVVDDQSTPVLTIPLQAIVGSAELGKERKCFVLKADGETEEREIELGLSNEKMAEVKSGLKEGEEVVLNPRVLLGDKNKTKTREAGAEKAAPSGHGGRPEGGRGPGGRQGPGGPPGQRPEAGMKGEWPGGGAPAGNPAGRPAK